MPPVTSTPRTLSGWTMRTRAAAAAVALSVVVGTGVGVVGGPAASRGIVAAMADPLSILDGRSPGARAAGALLQTKLRRAHGAPYSVRIAVPPRNSRTSDVMPRAVDVAEAAPVDVANVPVVDLIATDGVQPGAVIGGFAPGPAFGGGFPGVIGGGGGGGGVIAPPVVVPPVAVPPVVVDVPPVGSVPEPSTWAMLIMGFGMVGVSMRRRSPMARA